MQVNEIHAPPLIYNTVHEPVSTQAGKLVNAGHATAGADAQDEAHRFIVPPCCGLTPAAEDAANAIETFAPDKSGEY